MRSRTQIHEIDRQVNQVIPEVVRDPGTDQASPIAFLRQATADGHVDPCTICVRTADAASNSLAEVRSLTEPAKRQTESLSTRMKAGQRSHL